MQLSRRGRYALSALLDLVLCQERKELTTAREIAKRQKIPLPFLEQLLLSLKRHDLVASKRGPKGGYLLAKDPAKICVWEVFSAVEGPVAIVECLRAEMPCSRERNCLARPLWEKMNQALFKILKETSLEDLCHPKNIT